MYIKENIKLYNKDCFQIMKDMPDKSVDLVITDPPYLHNLKRFGKGGNNGMLSNSNMYSKDSEMMSELSNFTPDKCIKMLDELKRIMKLFDGYFFCNDRLLGTYCHWADENGLYVNLLTWNKPLSILDRRRYSTNCEFIVRIHTPSGTGLNKIDFDEFPEYKDYYSRYRYYTQIRGKNKLHPTQKPLDLIKGYILLSSHNIDDIVFDPFMGSGTTGVAAIETGRKFIGIDNNDEHFNTAKNRLSKIDI